MAVNTGCIRNAAGSNDQHQILIIDVHGARELPALLMALKFNSSEVQVGPDKLEVVHVAC